VAKTHQIPCRDGLFSAKEPYDYWLFCDKRLATSGILCIFYTLYQTPQRRFKSVAVCCSVLQCVGALHCAAVAARSSCIQPSSAETQIQGRSCVCESESRCVCVRLCVCVYVSLLLPGQKT